MGTNYSRSSVFSDHSFNLGRQDSRTCAETFQIYDNLPLTIFSTKSKQRHTGTRPDPQLVHALEPHEKITDLGFGPRARMKRLATGTLANRARVPSPATAWIRLSGALRRSSLSIGSAESNATVLYPTAANAIATRPLEERRLPLGARRKGGSAPPFSVLCRKYRL